MKKTTVLLVITAFSFTAGCRSARRKTSEIVIGTTAFLAKGIVNGIFDDDDETIIQRQRREGFEREWKQVWRDNPDVNPAMTAAFKDDYD